jgi:hypothetical protein
MVWCASRSDRAYRKVPAFTCSSETNSSDFSAHGHAATVILIGISSSSSTMCMFFSSDLQTSARVVVCP